jgi:hypothetical protein
VDQEEKVFEPTATEVAAEELEGKRGPIVASYLVKIVQRETDDERTPLLIARLEAVIVEAIEDELDSHGAITVSAERTDR